MDGDKLGMAFEMIVKFGLEKTLKLLLNIIPDPPSLVAVQEGFRDVERGDHLVYKTAMGWNSHFYVVDNLGGGSLKVYGCFLEGNDHQFIEGEFILRTGEAQKLKMEKRIIHEANGKQKFKKKLYDKPSNFHNEEYRVDVFKKQSGKYDLFYNNSEHFVNFMKTGEAKCQIGTEILNFLKKHVFVQAIKNCNMEMMKIIAVHNSWATILGALTVLVLKNSGVELATRSSLEKILIEAAKATTVKAIKNVATKIINEGGKVAAVQATKIAAKEVVKEGGKATACSSSDKECS